MTYIPQQELFDQMYVESDDLGFDTYDHLPTRSENAGYPFVVVGDTQEVPVNYKTAKGGLYTITMHVWGDAEQRFTVSQMLEQLANVAEGPLVTDHFHFTGRLNQDDKQILQDTSVQDSVLFHGVATLVFSLG